MRVFISIDMEGVAGIVSERHRTPGNEDYQWGRKLMVGEANAAIEGAFRAGAKEVLVNDSHNTMDNLLPELMDPRAKLLIGRYKPLSMMQGISKRFDAVMFIGYHAHRGTAQAIMDHTYSESTINTIRINGREAGETLINGLVAGYFGVPVVLVSGDRALEQEVHELDPKIQTVVVKEAITRYSAINHHPQAARDKICQGVEAALKSGDFPKPLKMRPPYRFEVNLIQTHSAEMCKRIPGVTLKAPRTVAFRQDDYLTGFKELLAVMNLAYA